MSDKKNIFTEDIELPEIVKIKAEHAFEKIKMEETIQMADRKNNDRKDRKSAMRFQVAVAASLGLLLASGLTAVAAIHHYWGRGMQGNLQASDVQQQQLTDQGVATVMSENPDYESMAITDAGVTVTPNTVIVDDRFVYMTFRVSGYAVEEGAEPGFDSVSVYQGENPEADGAWLNMSGTFYDGILSDENGAPVYEDGSALEYGEDGNFISHYTDENGDMEYMIQAMVSDFNDSMLGKTIHVDFQDLGTVYKADFSEGVAGNWNFTINLSDVSSATDIQIGQEIEGTDFVLDSINISPVSMKLNYTVNGTVEMREDDNGVPEFMGVVLKDGTRIPYLADGGGSGYTDESMTTAYQISGYDRVIDVDEVASLIIMPVLGEETIEVPVAE